MRRTLWVAGVALAFLFFALETSAGSDASKVLRLALTSRDPSESSSTWVAVLIERAVTEDITVSGTALTINRAGFGMMFPEHIASMQEENCVLRLTISNLSQQPVVLFLLESEILSPNSSQAVGLNWATNGDLPESIPSRSWTRCLANLFPSSLANPSRMPKSGDVISLRLYWRGDSDGVKRLGTWRWELRKASELLPQQQMTSSAPTSPAPQSLFSQWWVWAIILVVVGLIGMRMSQ